MPGGRGELRGLSQWVQLYTGAQINFGDLTPYLTYAEIGAVFITHNIISANACELEKYLFYTVVQHNKFSKGISELIS